MEKILLILESQITTQLLSEALSGYEVQSCRADDAADVLQQFRPDGLILDLFLPGTDGLSLLEACRELLPPVVLPLSLLVTDYILFRVSQLGIGYVIQKPCTVDYIAGHLTDMLRLQKFPGLPNRSDIVNALLEQLLPHTKPRVLTAFRIGILTVIQDPDCLLTKEVYPQICKTYGAGKDAVDQAFRRAIRKAWAQQNKPMWKLVFPNHTNCPTNGEFLLGCALYLQKKYPSRFRKGS